MVNPFLLTGSLEMNVGNQDKYTTHKNSGSWQLCHAVEEKLLAGWLVGS